MIPIPGTLVSQYQSWLKQRGVGSATAAEYLKWLRYFFDFCKKYPHSGPISLQVEPFLNKLREKNQSEKQCAAAAHAINLYLEMRQASALCPAQEPVIPSATPPKSDSRLRPAQYSPAGYEEKTDSPEWDDLLARLAAEIKVRHYSRKTLQTYARWSRSFQRYLKSKPPAELATADVKDYLTYLAVKCHVAASTQNQAFNSLLFLYRHALKRDFGDLRDVPRAKKSLYIPVVLSREEIDNGIFRSGS